MAELCAPIPDVSVTSKSVQIEDLEFSSDHRISHSHEGVGSGKAFFMSSNFCVRRAVLFFCNFMLFREVRIPDE